MSEKRRSFSEQLSAVLTYRNQPDHPPEPLQSNWSVVPANDNKATAKTESLVGEKLLRVTPTIEEIMRATRGDWVWDEEGRLVAIGHLRFSTGTQTEKAYMRGPDGDVVQYYRHMPIGAMLGCREQLTDDAGGQPSPPAVSNEELARRMGVQHRLYQRGTTRRPGKSYTAEQSRVLLGDAIANTKRMPPVTKCPPGIASGTARYSDQFIATKIVSSGHGALIQWQDLYSAGVDYAEYRKAHDALSTKDRKVLDKAMTAGSFAEIGTAAGQSMEYARRKGGRRALVAANDNLASAVKKLSA